MTMNTKWYPYPRFRRYFKLKDGYLMECHENKDGTRVNGPRRVKMHNIGLFERADLSAVIKELKDKE